MSRHVEVIHERLDELIDVFNSGLPPQLSLCRSAHGPPLHARWFNCLVTSVYQPIVQATSRRVIGHEGLLRCRDGEATLSPWGLFAHASSRVDLVALDRLCRTLHTLNYFSQMRQPLSLFLNVQPGLLDAVQSGFGLDFQQRLVLFGLSPHAVVIELPQEALAQHDLAARATSDYRSRGYRVALSAPASGNGWRRAARLQPDIIRIRAATLAQASRARDMVEEIHEAHALALADRIETLADEEHARAAGCDLLQGFRVAAPSTRAASGYLASDRVAVA